MTVDEVDFGLAAPLEVLQHRRFYISIARHDLVDPSGIIVPQPAGSLPAGRNRLDQHDRLMTSCIDAWFERRSRRWSLRSNSAATSPIQHPAGLASRVFRLLHSGSERFWQPGH